MSRMRLRASSVVAIAILGAGSAAAQDWVSHGPEGGVVNALVIDPADHNTLYAGTTWGGIFKSTDGGGSWSSANVGHDGSGQETNNGRARPIAVN